MRPRTSREVRWAALLFLVPATLALALYFPTFGSSWAYDDIDYLNQAAEVLSGKRGFWPIVFRPQGEHIIAGFRLVLFGSVSLFGIDATPYRLFVALAHAASAFFLGLLARRYGASPGGALVTAVAYVAACGFSSMWVWFPSGASVPFALALLTGAAAAVAWRSRLGVRRAHFLAGAAVVAALLTESTLAPMSALPMLIDEYERRQPGSPSRYRKWWSIGLFSIFCAVVTVGIAGLASYLYSQTFGPRMSVSFRHGLPRTAFLLLAAPFRYFFPGISILASEPGLRTAVLGSLLGLAVAAPVAALLLALWRRGAPRLAVVAVLAAAGPLGFLGLVGLGRWHSSYLDLYDADRYFFPLLIPLALLAGAAATSIGAGLREWPRRARAALALLLLAGLGAELFLHRRAMVGRMPLTVYQAHEDRFAQLSRLAARLERAAEALPPGEPPLEFPDNNLWFPEIHNGHVTASFLLHVLGDGHPRLRLGGERVDARNARLLNPVLETWAREEKEQLPYLSIADGRLVNARMVALADFRTGPHPQTVVSGFYGWEGSSRWMGQKGELLLALTGSALVFDLATPMDSLRRVYPAWQTLQVNVSVTDEATGVTVPLGTVEIAGESIQRYRLDATPFLARFGAGRLVRLVLQCDQVWKPSETLPGFTDSRQLTVQVFAAGAEAPLS